MAPLPELHPRVEEAKSSFVEISLVASLARVDELEHSERLLIAERDALRQQLRIVGEHLTRDLEAYARAPSYTDIFNYLSNTVRTATVVKRRDMWLGELSALNLSGPIFGVFPHNGVPGELSILVWGSGGIGDALYLSAVVRELYLMYRNCRIFVLHENPAARDVFASNPYVSGVLWLEKDELFRFVQTVHALDVFDLVAEVRYAVTYTTPPLARVPHEFVRSASYRSAEWQKYVRYQWPHLNNLFANEVISRGMNKLALVGFSSMLPIDAYSEIDFFISDSQREIAPELVGVAYATIHHGSDRQMSADGGVQTKNLPTQTWNRIVAELKAAGFRVVQLGEEHEQPVEGVDLDLRGRTSLELTAHMIKSAAVHVDTEGGLVHLARAVNTRSVVAFGPTPVGFFGYPQNENLAPPVCGNCWWVNANWSTRCPRELPAPECMGAHSGEEIARRAEAVARRARDFEACESLLAPTERIAGMVGETLKELADPGTRGAVVLGPNQEIRIIRELMPPAGRVTFYVDADRFQAARGTFGETCTIMPYTMETIPLNSAALDWAVAVGLDARAARTVSLCRELLRCVRPGGAISIGLEVTRADALRVFSENLEAMETWQIGLQDRLSTSILGQREPVAGETVFFKVVQRQPADSAAPASPDEATAALAGKSGLASTDSLSDAGSGQPLPAGNASVPAPLDAALVHDPEPVARAGQSPTASAPSANSGKGRVAAIPGAGRAVGKAQPPTRRAHADSSRVRAGRQ